MSTSGGLCPDGQRSGRSGIKGDGFIAPPYLGGSIGLAKAFVVVQDLAGAAS